MGRTFPNHPYFSASLGPGQLSLYNILKAYSLLDPEVGYCQGLSFVGGVLLMHSNNEEEAFNLLKHMMFGMGLRRQYKTDMTGLQVRFFRRLLFLCDGLFGHFMLNTFFSIAVFTRRRPLLVINLYIKNDKV